MPANRTAILRASFVATLLLYASIGSFAAEKVFDPNRDSAKDLAAAETQAAAQHKNILLDVGGNWCPWCILLDRTLHQDAQLTEALESNFVVVHVNWSEENQNQAFLSHYPPVDGYPFFFVLSPKGKLLRAQPTDPLEADHKIDSGYNKQAILEFLTRWAPGK
jgi:thioredoxin-related protein